MDRRIQRKIWLLCFLLTWGWVPLYGQEENKPAEVPSPTPVAQRVSEEEITNKIKTFTEQMDNLKKNLEAGRVNLATDVVNLQESQIKIVEGIILLANQQLSTLKKIESQIATQKQIQEKLEQFLATGPQEQPPYSYLLLDTMRSQLTVENDKKATVEDSLKSAQSALDAAKKTVAEKDTAFRLAKENHEKNQDPGMEPLLYGKLRVAQWELQAARERQQLLELELQSQKLSRDNYAANLKYMETRVGFFQGHTIFLDRDLTEQLERLDKDLHDLMIADERAKTDLNWSNIEHGKVQDEIAKAADPGIDLKEKELAFRFKKNYYQELVEVIQKRMGRVRDRQEAWKRRFATINNTATIEEMDTWKDGYTQKIASIDADIRSLGLIQSDYRKDQVNLDEKAEQAKENAKLVGYIKDQHTFLQKRIDVINDNLSSLETTRRLYSKLLKEIEEQRQTWSLKDFYEFVRIKGNALLSYELKKLEDESVLTLGKVILALLYLIFGFTLAGYVSRLFGRIVLSRFGVDEGASSAIQSLSYYVLLIIVFMMSLNAVQISLTAFAFLGGALAIGIGFGSQNILSNFISGLILLVERPIKVGDLIEVDGTSGTVKRIGARCTQVLTFSNVDMLVPNSKFLESKVVNLTHGDKVIRKEITVGVAYGSNPREVSKLIKKIIDEHGLILRNPEPYVLFNNFGDNCLEFEARFWVNLSTHNALIIMSDIRHRINSLFEEAGIVIAFPQRDVHLDTLSPLEFRLVKDSDEQSGLQKSTEKE